MTSRKRQLNIRLTEGGHYALRKLTAHFEASQAFVVECLIRQQVQAEGLTRLGRPKSLGKAPPKVTLAEYKRPYSAKPRRRKDEVADF